MALLYTIFLQIDSVFRKFNIFTVVIFLKMQYNVMMTDDMHPWISKEERIMALLEFIVPTQPDTIDEIAAVLTMAGFEDFLMEDQTEFEAFLEENRAYWDYIDEELQEKLQGLSQIKVYIEETETQRIDALQQLLTERGLTSTVSKMPEVDWMESWKENYPPVEVGNRLTVLPYWLADTPLNGRLPVILDPGLTFGTGSHPSTQMVMEAMEENLIPGGHCLDLGSGSGILSIAALRLGAASATGVDIDPKAEDIARENAAYNGYAAPEFTACTGNVTADKGLMERLSKDSYRLVLVNIVADVIIALAPVLPRFMTADTVLICSGILDSRYADVAKALEQAGLSLTATREKEEWRCICAKRSAV